MFEASRQFKSAILATADLAAAPPVEIDFLKVLSVLWRGRAKILWTTAASLALAVLFVLVAPHRYTAVTELLIDPVDLRAVANEPAPSSQASDTALLAVDSQVRVLTSDDVLRRVVDGQGLAHDPEFVGGQSPLHAFEDGVLAMLGRGKTLVAADPSLAALNELRRRVEVKRAEHTYVVDVRVTSKYPEKAARLANALTDAYLGEQTQVRADAARRISQSLSARLQELQNRVRESEDRVAAFKARNNIVDANGQLVNEQQLTELNRLLEVARYHSAEAKARYEQIQRLQQSKADIGAFSQAVQSPTVTALRSQYAEIMRREAEQMTSLGARHPAVIEIQAEAERLRGMIQDEINRTALSARSDYESAIANEATLSRNLDALKNNAIATDEAMVRLRELQREAQASRAVYEAFLARARETGEQARVDTKNIQVISRANLPLYRSWPPSNLLLALGAVFVGVAAGSGLVMLRGPQEQTAPRRGKDPSRRKLGVSRKALPPAAAVAADVPVLAVVPPIDKSFSLDAVDDPTSPFAMGIRKVYEALRASHKKRGNPSVLIVASNDGDDSAAVALTLAAMAAATQHVLLIDADLERRTLSAIDADESEAGLVDVAVGRRLLSDIVVRDRGTNINLLPFVSPHSRRDRRIKDEDIRVAFAQTKQFDMVIVAATDLTRDPSTRFFAGLVDHIVLVARTDEADEGAVDEFVSRLALDARKIRGAVLTAARRREPAFGDPQA